MNFQTGRLMGVLTAAVMAAAMTVSAAQARPDDRGGMLGVGNATSVQNDRPDDRPGTLGVGGTTQAVQVEQAAVRPDDRSGVRGPGTTPAPVTLSHPAAADGGFEWGSQEIATGIALLMALLAGATLLASHRRERTIRY
jgi:hypothetical protein